MHVHMYKLLSSFDVMINNLPKVELLHDCCFIKVWSPVINSLPFSELIELFTVWYVGNPVGSVCAQWRVLNDAEIPSLVTQ